MFKSISALVTTITAKECYEAVGTFNLNGAEGPVDAKMEVCWPKTSDNGALATGTGFYDDGTAKGQAMTITHAWVADKKILTLRILEKFLRTYNYCSIMCELDEDAVCSGYLSCQPDVFGSVSFKLFAFLEQTEEPEPEPVPAPEQTEEPEPVPAPEQTEEPEPAPKARGKFSVPDAKEEPEPRPKAKGKFGITEEEEEPEPAPKAKGKFGVTEEEDEPEPAPKARGKFGVTEEEDEPEPAPKARGKFGVSEEKEEPAFKARGKRS
jgi:hypothetical protein